jgi:hypothetical protein
MKIRIHTSNNKEITTELSPQDYEELKNGLSQGRIKFINIENQLLKSSFINSIEAVAEPILIPKERRISEEAGGPEHIKGSIDRRREQLNKMWENLKEKDWFRGYNSVEEYRKAKGYA